jgi:hypothetical protein
MDMPPHARAVSFGRGHRFAAYPRCWADYGESELGMTAQHVAPPNWFGLCALLAAGIVGCVEVEQTWTSGPLRSPGGRWIAEVHDATHGWNTLPRTVVDVRMPTEPLPTVVLEPWGDWTGGENVEVRWREAQVLEITVPNRTAFDTRLQSYKGLVVEVRFRADNPADRRFWWRRHTGELSLRQPESPAKTPSVERGAAQQRDEADER